MKYLEIVKKLQNLRSNIDVLVLVRSGVFFYGVGKDAVILTEYLGLNYCCIKQGVCKCAIPVVKIEANLFCNKAKINKEKMKQILNQINKEENLS